MISRPEYSWRAIFRSAKHVSSSSHARRGFLSARVKWALRDGPEYCAVSSHPGRNTRSQNSKPIEPSASHKRHQAFRCIVPSMVCLITPPGGTRFDPRCAGVIAGLYNDMTRVRNTCPNARQQLRAIFYMLDDIKQRDHVEFSARRNIL